MMYVKRMPIWARPSILAPAKGANCQNVDGPFRNSSHLTQLLTKMHIMKHVVHILRASSKRRCSVLFTVVQMHESAWRGRGQKRRVTQACCKAGLHAQSR